MMQSIMALRRSLSITFTPQQLAEGYESWVVIMTPSFITEVTRVTARIRLLVFRNGRDLQAALEELQSLYERSQDLGLRSNGKGSNPELAVALRLRGMLRLAICITYGALKRTESRGAHYREDYPDRDDANFLNRTLFRWKVEADMLPEIQYEPVRITELPPGERGYGERAFKSD